MEFCSISSGSKGNSYVVKDKESIILIDAGISAKKIIEGLENLNIELNDLDAVLITHEHSDHIKGLRVLKNKGLKAKIYMNNNTWDSIKEKYKPDDSVVCFFKTGDSFKVDHLKIDTFALHHDAAETVGYAISDGNKSLGFLTDTGYVCDQIYENIKNVDLLVLESNHDEEVLKVCSYPYEIKRRILGEMGHLSNISAGKVILKILRDKDRNQDKFLKVLLAHMSEENNSPHMALITVESILKEKRMLDLKRINIGVLLQNQQSKVFEV